jgi:hypothetical protein
MKLRLGKPILIAGALLAGCATRTPPAANVAAPEPVETSIARLSASSEEPAAPATNPALPAGHPALPSGHPDISNLAPAEPALPAGHPQITKSNSPATQPAAIGVLTVRAVQGTKGGPAVSGDDVTVEIYENNRLTGSVSGKLDSNGAVSIDGVPISPRHQALVKVTHAGVEYQGIAESASATNNVLQLSVPVYEATEQTPDWSVQMQHMIVQPVEGGVQVMEVLAIANPTDRAWIGTKQSGAEKPVTFTIQLPTGASDVTLVGGFHECCTSIANGQIVNSMALVPGTTKYQFAYVVPSENGVAKLTAIAPALTKHLMVIIPDDGTKVSGEGVDGPKTTDMGNGKTRYLAATDLPAGKQIAVTISGTPAMKSSGTSTSSEATVDSSGIAKALAGTGAVLILLIGGALLLIKSPRTAKAQKS